LTMAVPGLRSLLGLAPVSLLDGLVISGSAVLPLLVNEATKQLPTDGADDHEKLEMEDWRLAGPEQPGAAVPPIAASPKDR
jgi:Ca2+-transporting ATPase